MHWYQEDEYEDEEEDLMFSPALLSRRASESWIVEPPAEVSTYFYTCLNTVSMLWTNMFQFEKKIN